MSIHKLLVVFLSKFTMRREPKQCRRDARSLGGRGGAPEGWAEGSAAQPASGTWGEPGCLKSQTGQISRKFNFFGTICHFLAPLGVLTPTSILNFAAFFFVSQGRVMGSNAKFKKKIQIRLLDF